MSATTADTTTTDTPGGLTEPTFELATIPYEGDEPFSELPSRDQKSYRENIAIVPQFDSYGEVPKQKSATYDVFSASGSEYETSLTGKERCGCRDVIFNTPEDGCKHNRKLHTLLERGDIPAPREYVGEWVTTDLYQWIVAVAQRRVELRASRQQAAYADAPEYDPDEYDDPIETATAILAGLRDSYEDYRTRVDEDAPQLPPVCWLDTETDDEDSDSDEG